MKNLLYLLVALLLSTSLLCQDINIEPYHVGDRIPDLPLCRIINYKDSAAYLSSFGNKLIIFDFWGIHCSSCIEMFPFEDSIQHVFNDKLQIVLVTSDPKDKVIAFFKKWDSTHNKKFSLPIVCSDSIISGLFRLRTIPIYAWIAPQGSFLGESENKYFMNASTIKYVMDTILNDVQEMKNKKYPKSLTEFRKPSPSLLKLFELNSLDHYLNK